MSPTSFRRDIGQRPQYYRTPSPPRYAFEPISPIHNENFSPAHKAHGQDEGGLDVANKMDSYAPQSISDLELQKENSISKMEAFASIALAVTPVHQGQAGLSSEFPTRELKTKRLIVIA